MRTTVALNVIIETARPVANRPVIVCVSELNVITFNTGFWFLYTISIIAIAIMPTIAY